jgi:putative Mg2+ transporter-C (MgtC) family protein
MPIDNLGLLDVLCRLGAATLAGAVIGLNRNLHRQGAGLRTYGLVALATAGLTVGILMTGGGNESFSRVVQGIMAGVGFLGGGVILRRADGARITGLTSAAAVWFVAAIAVVCALGFWTLTAILMSLALGLLVFGRTIERTVERVFGADGEDDEVHESR